MDVLLIDDDEDDYQLTRDLIEELQDGYRLDWAPTFEDGLASLRQRAYAVCLLDYYLDGGRTGLDFLEETHASGCSVPIVVLSGVGDLEKQTLSAGATDYLTKGKLDSEQLSRSLRHAVERQRYDAQLHERERLFRAIFDGSHDAMLIVDDAARFVDANPEALRLLGRSRDALAKATSFGELIGSDDDRAGAFWAALIREGKRSAEWELAWQGDTRVLDLRATARILPGRHLVVLRDITERRRAEMARARLAAIAESADDAIMSTDAEWRIVDWNAGAERLYGYRAADAKGRKAVEFAPPERVAELAELQRKVMSGSAVAAIETVRVREDGSRVEVSLSLVPMRDANGRVVGVSAIARDITETNRMRARLALSDRMASIGTLAAGIAHEINNPLAAVMANLDVASRDLERVRSIGCGVQLGQAFECVRDAAEAADRVRNIVRDVKLFSRAADDELAAVDVRAVLRSSIRMLWNEIRHRARLVEDCELVPTIDANESRLGQVFLNLLINAAQAIPEGNADGNTIRVSTRANERHVVVEVSDSGAGIPPETLARIFDPFFTTKPVGVGTGLGLPICQSIVAASGGEIEVESRVGVGTTLRVLLPIGQLRQSAPLVESTVPPVAVRARVLVVDDELSVVRALERLLASRHDVVGVARACDAIARIRSGERFDVILSDLMMPEMGGIELYEQLSAIAPDAAARVVFLTGGAFTPRARDFLAAVPNVCIEKPVDRSRLLGVIRSMLE